MLSLGTTMVTLPFSGLLKRLTSSRIVLHFLFSSAVDAVSPSSAGAAPSYTVDVPSTASSWAYSIVANTEANGSSVTTETSPVSPSTVYPSTALPQPVRPAVTAKIMSRPAALLRHNLSSLIHLSPCGPKPPACYALFRTNDVHFIISIHTMPVKFRAGKKRPPQSRIAAAGFLLSVLFVIDLLRADELDTQREQL